MRGLLKRWILLPGAPSKIAKSHEGSTETWILLPSAPSKDRQIAGGVYRKVGLCWPAPPNFWVSKVGFDFGAPSPPGAYQKIQKNKKRADAYRGVYHFFFARGRISAHIGRIPGVYQHKFKGAEHWVLARSHMRKV